MGFQQEENAVDLLLDGSLWFQLEKKFQIHHLAELQSKESSLDPLV